MLLRISAILIASMATIALASPKAEAPKAPISPKKEIATEPLTVKKQTIAEQLSVDSAMLDEMSADDVDFSEGDEALTDADFIDLQ